MNLLLDSNILLYITRAKNPQGLIDLLNPNDAIVYLSIVSVAEINAIALKNKWGFKRIEFLDLILDQFYIIDINRSFVSTYAEIDAYSQRSNPAFTDPNFATPRNMGKNDLWIASVAALFSLELITTDDDFDHLHNTFFEVRKLGYTNMVKFL